MASLIEVAAVFLSHREPLEPARLANLLDQPADAELPELVEEETEVEAEPSVLGEPDPS